MAVPYTKAMLIELVKKHMSNGFAGSDWNASDNEILILIDAAIPQVLKGQMFENFKLANVFEVPDAYLLNYEYTISTKDSKDWWYLTLPQAPLALPSGYDITSVYISSTADGVGDYAYPLKAKRQPFRNLMPKPLGYEYKVEGATLYLKCTNGASLYQQTVNVTLPISRTASVSDPLYLPDDAIEPLFQKVVSLLKDRMGIPQDVIQDGLPAGNKTS